MVLNFHLVVRRREVVDHIMWFIAACDARRHVRQTLVEVVYIMIQQLAPQTHARSEGLSDHPDFCTRDSEAWSQPSSIIGFV